MNDLVKRLREELAQDQHYWPNSEFVHIRRSDVEAVITALSAQEPQAEKVCEHEFGMRQTAPDWAANAGMTFDVCRKCGVTKEVGPTPQPAQAPETPSFACPWCKTSDECMGAC
jgi:hypothetical protein